MKTTALLKNLIREIVLEAAVTPAAATQQGLGLCTFDDGPHTTYVLYNVKNLESLLKSEGDDGLMGRSMSDDDVVVGTITVTDPPSDQPSWGSKIIVQTAAEKGYGPMLYDIVISDQDGLTPDRSKVSDKAKRIWNVYFDRSDVKHLPLDDSKNPKTKEKIDDAELHPGSDKNVLNYAYRLKNKVSFEGLVNNHKELMKRLGNLARPAQRYLDTAAFNYFLDRYHS